MHLPLRKWGQDWLRLQVGSGTDNMETVDHTEQQKRLFSVLDRQCAFEPMEALVNALRPIPNEVALARTAIGLDANVFLRLGNHTKGEDIIDYLDSSHSAPP